MALKFNKDPDAVRDYELDWQSEWMPKGDVLTAAASTVSSGGTELVVDRTEFTVDGKTVTWLSGGKDGVNYDVVVHVTTEQGRQDDCSFTIVCRER